jgi:DNA-directed RNA polymerase subunit M/transcription elongation factor TFIIS
MGEYAVRKSDNETIKVGTCEDMYYIRFEDRNEIMEDDGTESPLSTDTSLRWRLPFPDEDEVDIGEYDQHDRSVPLFKTETDGTVELFDMEIVDGDHFKGCKTPHSYYALQSVKMTNDGMMAIVKCRDCRMMWRADMDDVLPYITDKPELVNRLKAYCAKGAE